MRAARESLERFVPDVVLTDWLLPDGEGLDVCEAVWSRRATRGVPVIAVTGLTLDEERRTRARARGAVGILEKPADPDAILSAIGDALTIGTERRVRAAAARAKRYAEHLFRHAPRHHDGAVHPHAEAVALVERAAARSGEAVTLVIADDTARYVAAGGSARELTGYDARELEALSVWDLTPPTDTSDSQGLWEQFIAAGMQEGHYVLRHRDGQGIEAQYCAMANIAPGWHVSAIAQRPLMPLHLAGI